jgi:glutamine synthetase
MGNEIEFSTKTGYKKLTKEEVKAVIAEKGIEMIRLEWADIHGISRGKTLPSDMIDTIFESGIPFCSAVLAQCFDNQIAEAKGLIENHYDDMCVRPDPSTFVVLPHVEKTALLLGTLYYHGKPMKQSPRGFLQRMIDEYNKLGLNPIAAGELEFFLFKKEADGTFPPYTNKVNNCYTDNSRVDPLGYLYKLTKTFKNMGFKILYMNHEYYPGQYEYNWKHGPALRNADETFLFKSISKDIADQNDLYITFMAKPKNENGGSGCHVHFSLDDINTGEDLFYDEKAEDGMSDLMKYFVAGILKHARALTALLAPTVNCYKRYVPDSFAPCYIGWGNDNRTTFVRIPEDRGKGTRVEVRAGSAAANPYLAFGGILAAGLDGIKNKLEPPAIITSDLYHDKDKQKHFVPRSLYRALEELEKDECLCESVGKELIDTFVAMKRIEVETYTNMVTDWEWDTYSYHI